MVICVLVLLAGTAVVVGLLVSGFGPAEELPDSKKPTIVTLLRFVPVIVSVVVALLGAAEVGLSDVRVAAFVSLGANRFTVVAACPLFGSEIVCGP